jgi:hypothetical protein
MTSILLTLLLSLQTPPGEGKPPVSVPAPAPQTVLAPGVLPADSTPEARALWMSLVAALQPKATGEALAAIDAFDLSITTRVTSVTDDGSRQRNDVQLRFRYLAPKFVSRMFVDSKVETMRGPDGDWLWDPAKDDRIQLAGADFAQDRRELSQTLSMARNYLALAQPGNLRIAQLARLSAPPPELPVIDPADPATPKDSALTRVASLEWISLLSPDFQVVESVKSNEPPMFRAQIGLDPKTHLPLVAVIHQDEHGTRDSETAVLVDFTTTPYKLIDERLVPQFFRVHDPLLPSSPFTFQREAHMSVFVNRGSTLRAKLTPDDFRPPKPISK